MKTRKNKDSDKVTNGDIELFKETIKVLNAVRDGSIQTTLIDGDLNGMKSERILKILRYLENSGQLLSTFSWISHKNILSGSVLMTLSERGEKMRLSGSSLSTEREIRTLLEQKMKEFNDKTLGLKSLKTK